MNPLNIISSFSLYKLDLLHKHGVLSIDYNSGIVRYQRNDGVDLAENGDFLSARTTRWWWQILA